MKRLLFALMGLLLIASFGCRSVQYEDKAGRRLSINSLGTSAGIAKATVKTADGGELTIEGYTSDATKALSVAEKALSVLPVK